MDVDVVLAVEELVLAMVDIIPPREVPVSLTLRQSTVVVNSPLATRVCRDQRRVKKGRHGVDRTVTTIHNVCACIESCITTSVVCCNVFNLNSCICSGYNTRRSLV